jgi:hypothetical protein
VLVVSISKNTRQGTEGSVVMGATGLTWVGDGSHDGHRHVPTHSASSHVLGGFTALSLLVGLKEPKELPVLAPGLVSSWRRVTNCGYIRCK